MHCEMEKPKFDIVLSDLPCYLVPSSRGRLLVIPMTVSLQASRSLVSAHSSVSVQFVMALMSSSHRARGLPLFLAPPPIPNIIDFSKLFSLRMMCPKYDSCDSLRNFGGTGGGRCVQLSVNIESLTPGQAICHVKFAEQCFCSEAARCNHRVLLKRVSH